MSYLRTFSSYQIPQELAQETAGEAYAYISAPVLFVLTFCALRIPIRKLFFINQVRMKPKDCLAISIPRRMFLTQNTSESWQESFENLLGLLLSSWYSVYSLYKALKKYNDVKYIVSFTRAGSRVTGFLCALTLPRPLRYVFYGGFAKFYGINMDEVSEPDFGEYETFTKFFTRTLKDGARTICDPDDALNMCSPCDGRILTCGKVNSEFSTIDCVKGRSYRLDEFMLGVQGETHKDFVTDSIPNNTSVAAMLDKVKQRGNQLLYMVIYLSPADYHRFHSPV